MEKLQLIVSIKKCRILSALTKFLGKMLSNKCLIIFLSNKSSHIYIPKILQFKFLVKKHCKI